MKNERDKWELPGGKLELSEDPEFGCVREIKEELGLNVKARLILDSWVYHNYIWLLSESFFKDYL
ncbi:NUDIX hydrolase [Nostoc sp.]|uniref:NUDIX hydrolase n=1 Tax=Nostoc sp. TaxID=1180 RepID=UPI002FF4FBD9